MVYSGYTSGKLGRSMVYSGYTSDTLGRSMVYSGYTSDTLGRSMVYSGYTSGTLKIERLESQIIKNYLYRYASICSGEFLFRSDSVLYLLT
jgi:hypothetical protein